MTPAAPAQTLPGPDAVRARVRAVLDAHWQDVGYTVPNQRVYPHQWLWDSCFHAVIWSHLGVPDRGVAELRNVFAHQSDDGFVPHMTYWRAAQMHEEFWGRSHTSSITQPPMYGHAIAELARLGTTVDRDLVDAARAGLEFLLRGRERDGAVVIVHPWESGCDDSPRWDAWADTPWTPAAWKRQKGDLVAAVRLDPSTGASIGNPAFEVASSAFEALVTFNALELATVAPEDAALVELRSAALALGARTRARWDGARRTFVDRHVCGIPRSVVGPGSSSVRTLEALLPVLCGEAGGGPANDDEVFAPVVDAAAFGAACGPAQVHRGEESYDPGRYWRGGTWPQLSYLVWLAARRSGREAVARSVRDATVRGAWRSGLAEYWDPDTGSGLGAIPQTWTGLAAVMAGA